MDESLDALEAEYCPPLDAALFSAIVSDYDLADQAQLQQVRLVLDELKTSAILEEAADFDPSGTGAGHHPPSPANGPESCPDTNLSLSKDTDVTSLSNGVCSLDFEGSDETNSPIPIGSTEEIENADEDTKIQLLQQVFGSGVSRYNAKHTLRKCDWKWQAALEVLLNHVYFNEEQPEGWQNIGAKGVDGFAETVPKRGRKGKSKAKKNHDSHQHRSSSLPAEFDEGVPIRSNKWQTGSTDIEFIASRIRIPTSTVSSTYYANGASIPRTINTLIKASMDEAKHLPHDVATIATCVHNLSEQFPRVVPSYLQVIALLTYPSNTSALDLCKALTAKPKVDTTFTDLTPQYVPFSASHAEPPSPTITTFSGNRGVSTETSAAAYAQMKSTAYAQARSMYRKAKSDRLMGGAAAYYSEVAREQSILQLQATATEADALVASQNASANELDLHGIDVVNAVRIARKKVKEWWEGSQEKEGRLGAQERNLGYRIVVGAGKHSLGGKSKLGPAVGKMLRDEGWKMEAQGAVIVVRGRTR